MPKKDLFPSQIERQCPVTSLTILKRVVIPTNFVVDYPLSSYQSDIMTDKYPGMAPLKNRNEYTQALMPDGTVVMEGITKNCPICKGMKPLISNMQKKYPDAKFYVFDVDEAEDIAQELGARNVPNFR